MKASNWKTTMATNKYFINTNGIVTVASIDLNSSKNSLEPAVYAIKYDMNRGFFLSVQEDRYTLPEKIFGDNNNRAERIIKSYETRTKGTGVLLVGEKGSGKTVLAKTICNMAIDKGLPVISVAENFSGTSFNEFIDNLGNCVLLFDEFAKVYEKEQHKLLSLFDGTSESKRITILTENDIYSIQEHMKNRPGRFLYRYEYTGVDSTVIEELGAFYSIPEDVIEDIVKYSKKVRTFTMDILYTIIEEYKTFGTTHVQDMVKYLNIDTITQQQFAVLSAEVFDEETGEKLDYELETKVIYDLENFSIRLSGIKKDSEHSCKDAEEPAIKNADDEDFPDFINLYNHHIIQQTDSAIVFSRDGRIVKIKYKEQEYAGYRFLI